MSRTPSSPAFPSPSPDDASDVSVALEAAQALWDNGEIEEAMRWLARAVESSERGGDDRRALELARAVADLKDGLAAQVSQPPAAASPKPMTRPPPLPPPGPATKPPEPPATAAPATKTLAPPPTAPPAPKAPAPQPTAASTTKTPPPAPSARKSLPPTPPSMRPRPPQAAAAPKTEPAGADRLRVSVKSSVRDPDLLLVRVLSQGQAVPSGCHEAFLSPAQTGIDLRRLRS